MDFKQELQNVLQKHVTIFPLLIMRLLVILICQAVNQTLIGTVN